MRTQKETYQNTESSTIVHVIRSLHKSEWLDCTLTAPTLNLHSYTAGGVRLLSAGIHTQHNTQSPRSHNINVPVSARKTFPWHNLFLQNSVVY
jgi:hypothetical protein